MIGPQCCTLDVLLLLIRADQVLLAPYNAEPHKCAGIAWYPMTALPASTVPYSALGVSLHRRQACFGAIGW